MSRTNEILFGDDPAAAREELARLIHAVTEHHDWVYATSHTFCSREGQLDSAGVTTQDKHEGEFISSYIEFEAGDSK